MIYILNYFMRNIIIHTFLFYNQNKEKRPSVWTGFFHYTTFFHNCGFNELLKQIATQDCQNKKKNGLGCSKCTTEQSQTLYYN